MTMFERLEWRTLVATGKFFTLIMIVIFLIVDPVRPRISMILVADYGILSFVAKVGLCCYNCHGLKVELIFYLSTHITMTNILSILSLLSGQLAIIQPQFITFLVICNLVICLVISRD